MFLRLCSIFVLRDVGPIDDGSIYDKYRIDSIYVETEEKKWILVNKFNDYNDLVSMSKWLKQYVWYSSYSSMSVKPSHLSDTRNYSSLWVDGNSFPYQT